MSSWLARVRRPASTSLHVAPRIQIIDAPIEETGKFGLFFARTFRGVRNWWLFGPQERLDWYDNMAAMRQRKTTTEKALTKITAGNVKFGRRAAKVYAAMLPVLRRGESIDAAAQSFVPPTELTLLAAGDRASTPAGYVAAAKMLRALQAMRQSLVKNLSYPAIMLLASAPVIFVLADKIVPIGKDLARDEPLSDADTAFIMFAEFYTANVGYITVALVALLVAGILSLTRWTGRGRRFADRWFPPFVIYRHYTAAVFLAALGALLRTEMSIDLALTHLSARASGYLREHIEPIILTYRKGENEAAAFDTGLLDHNMLIRIDAMAESGSLKEAINVLSDDIVIYSGKLIGRIGVTLGTSIFLLISVFVGWAFAFIYGIGFAAADKYNAAF